MNIQSIIDQSIKDEQESRSGRVRSGKFSPSSFGRCFRNQYWNRADEPKTNPIDIRTFRVFKCGDLFHNFVKQQLRTRLITEGYQEEVRIENDDCLGFADFVCNGFVGEIKSQHSHKFWYMTQQKNESEEVYNKRMIEDIKPNILQSCFYAWELEKQEFILIFLSKDDLSIMQFQYKTKDFVPILADEMKSLREYWTKQELPPAKPRCYWSKKEQCFKECEYCGWLDKCKEVEKMKK
jgi:hypothetical protein